MEIMSSDIDCLQGCILWSIYRARAQRNVLYLFADNNQAAADAQWVIDAGESWSKDWKLNLNASKSKVTLCSTWTDKANYIIYGLHQ